MKLTTEQLARLLYKSIHEPRRNQKRFLKDLGGDGSAEELDRVLAEAVQDNAAVAESKRLERQRKITASTVELGVDARVAEMLADVKLRMDDLGMTQADIADACGWQQPLVSQYLRGEKEPGAKNLAKLAAAVGCVWRLHIAD
jgi:hypothetical protein